VAGVQSCRLVLDIALPLPCRRQTPGQKDGMPTYRQLAGGSTSQAPGLHSIRHLIPLRTDPSVFA
jgi:hypothetical protein